MNELARRPAGPGYDIFVGRCHSVSERPLANLAPTALSLLLSEYRLMKMKPSLAVDEMFPEGAGSYMDIEEVRPFRDAVNLDV